MSWIVVRTYGNGCHMNKVLPFIFSYLSQTEEIIEYLNHNDCDDSEKWIAMPLTKYKGPTHSSHGKREKR